MNASDMQKVDFRQILDCYPSNRQNFHYLIRLLQRHTVIPFIGAGFSSNFGYPGWSEFLEKQAGIYKLPQISDELDHHHFEEAASILKNYLRGNAMEILLLQEFGDQIYKAAVYPSALNILPELFPNLIITTNFDEVIELLYAKVNGEYIEKLTPQTLHDTRIMYKRIACGDPTLIKLHGDVASREFVLTKEEYDRHYGDGVLDIRLPLPSFLRDVLLSKILLFLGCSLKDDRTLKVIEQARIDGSMSFAFLPLPKTTQNSEDEWKPLITKDLNGRCTEEQEFKERKQFLDKHNIIPIWYPYGQHQALGLFLKELSYYVLPKYQLSTTQLHKRLDQLLQEDSEARQDELYAIYREAEEMIRSNKQRLDDDYQILMLNKIKQFYAINGYICDHKEVIQDLIDVTKHAKGSTSLDLIWVYHDIGYTFERFHYYELLLCAIQHAQKLLEQYEANKISEREQDIFQKKALINAKAAMYTGLGYAYWKSGRTEKAKEWYQKAEAMKDNKLLDPSWKAFIDNGLNRYYIMLNDPTKALETLDIALEERRALAEHEDESLAQHVINSHSNKIQIYLKYGQVGEALQEYDTCKNEPIVKKKLKYIPDAHQRLLTDYGDILSAQKEYKRSVEQYHKALNIRQYLHMEDDLIAAELYKKIAEALSFIDDNNKLDEALEYCIQAYLIFEDQFDENSSETAEVMEEIENLIDRLGYSNDILVQRLSAQRTAKKMRFNPKIQRRQKELIKYFGFSPKIKGD